MPKIKLLVLVHYLPILVHYLLILKKFQKPPRSMTANSEQDPNLLGVQIINFISKVFFAYFFQRRQFCG